MRFRPAKRKRFRSKVDTLLSAGLRLNIARSSPAKALSATARLLQLPRSRQTSALSLLQRGSDPCPSSHCRHQIRTNWGGGCPPTSGPRSLNPALAHFSVHPRAGCIVNKHGSVSWNKRNPTRPEIGADSQHLGPAVPVPCGHSQGDKQISARGETELPHTEEISLP